MKMISWRKYSTTLLILIRLTATTLSLHRKISSHQEIPSAPTSKALCPHPIKLSTSITITAITAIIAITITPVVVAITTPRLKSLGKNLRRTNSQLITKQVTWRQQRTGHQWLSELWTWTSTTSWNSQCTTSKTKYPKNTYKTQSIT